MKKILLAALFLPSIALAGDVCCVFSSANGDTIQTFASIVAEANCSGDYQGKKACQKVDDPQNTYCSSTSSAQDRCQKCGYFWSGKQCMAEDPVATAKRKLEDEAKAKDKNGKPVPATPTPSAPASPPSSPDGAKMSNPTGYNNTSNPDNDQFFTRRNRGTVNPDDSTSQAPQ